MKSRIFTLILFMAPIFLFGQLGLGVKAGANFANMSTDDYSTSSVTSFHAGAYANIHFSDTWSITPEVLWSSQGADLDNVEFITDYVTIPIMLRWHIIDLISLEAGPQFNLLVNATSNGVDVTGDFTATSFCAAFGGLVHLPLGLHAGARYVLGLTDLSESDMIEIKDRTFQVYVGWTIIGSK